jgi:hypothetical protein
MKKSHMPFAILLGTITCLGTACKKNTIEAPPAAGNESVSVNAFRTALQANLSFIRSFSTALTGKDRTRTNENGELPGTLTEVCPAFTLAFDTTGGWGVALGYDYGNGCPNDLAMGIIRKGKVTYKYFISNDLTHAIRVRYENFRDNSTSYNGVFTTSYQYGASGSNWFLGANDLLVTNSIWGNARYQAALWYRQTQGSNTPWVAADDVYLITGTTTVVSSTTGLSTYEALTPLVNALNCSFIVAGRLKITLGNTTGIVDFGNGVCDNAASLEIGGQVIPITL